MITHPSPLDGHMKNKQKRSMHQVPGKNKMSSDMG